jgi:hypothetical protein
MELSSERALMAFIISINTNTLNERVDAFYLP